MKKPLYIVIWSIFGIIASFIIWFAICFASVMRTPPPFDFEAAKDKFHQNREQFVYVADCFIELKLKSIFPEPVDNKGQKYINPKDLPDDSKLYTAINTLFENGCVSFENDWGTVKFLMCDTFDTHSGILYFENDVSNILNSFICLKKISDNWYYYEETMRISLE